MTHASTAPESTHTAKTRKPVAHQLPRLSFGGAPIGNLYAGVEEHDALATVRHALQQGVRHFDTAPYYGYGLSESRLGAALAGVPRGDYSLSTKVGRLLLDADDGAPTADDGFAVRGRRAVFDYSRDGILRSVESSLRRLGTDHVEILLLHDIGALTHGANHASVLRQALDEALPAMTELRSQGVCGAIGLGVNEQDVCLQVMPEFPLDVIMLAGRYTLFEQHDSAQLMTLAARQGVAVMAAGPYNSGLLGADGGPGDTYNYAPADAATRARAQRFYDVCGQFGASVGAAALQFPLGHPAVATVVCGLRSNAEVDSAVQRLHAPLPPALWTELRQTGLLVADAITP
ncbi:aldo/keto reductase [Rhodanobacter sp. DHB23]|uniref:aldo/keto reductase n=1 Tax=Rhodanobacter sp. DHB23 TaxID=2775923 RepID=UPI00178170E9|nr:aldo/keto reductase [Rhodanobacter sp. DHB23]MBD8873025.1 aldo/keto reductase [Rhodanobacter sp. DHB23]